MSDKRGCHGLIDVQYDNMGRPYINCTNCTAWYEVKLSHKKPPTSSIKERVIISTNTTTIAVGMSSMTTIVALCNDGTLWSKEVVLDGSSQKISVGKWLQVEKIPQPQD